MTIGSYLALWEILKDKVFRSRLDGFLANLFWDGLRHPALIGLCSLFLVFLPIPCTLAFWRPGNLKEDHVHTRAALQALVAIVVPTCSLWPRRYINLTSVVRPHVNIPLELIIEDTINGVIEFRNPINDLTDLISSGATVNGYTVCLKIGWKWWFRYFEWCLLAKSNPDYSRNLSLSPFAPASSTSCPLLCLDCLPRGVIPTLDAGSKTILEFTTFSSSLRALSTAQIISAVPFMISERSRRQPPSLVSVLKQLDALYGPDMTIDSLSNVSVDYENTLRHMCKSFSLGQEFPEMREGFLGTKAQRREMFLVALEAALVRRGWIERWAVQVTVK